MCPINSLNKLLKMRPSISPLRTLQSLHSGQRWRNTTLRGMPYKMWIPSRPGKSPQDSLSSSLKMPKMNMFLIHNMSKLTTRRLSTSPLHKRLSRQKGPP